METKYRTKSLSKICTIYSEAQKKYGVNMADKIHQRIAEITAADSVEMMIDYGIGRCHPLHGNRRDQYAVDLVHPYRMVFSVAREQVQVVCIEEVTDYH